MFVMATLQVGAQSYLLQDSDEQIVHFVVEYRRHFGVLAGVVIRQRLALCTSPHIANQSRHPVRAGLRRVRDVRPNRAADIRGPPFWTPKIPYKLTCQFERL